jgi:hypothetical protein
MQLDILDGRLVWTDRSDKYLESSGIRMGRTPMASVNCSPRDIPPRFRLLALRGRVRRANIGINGGVLRIASEVIRQVAAGHACFSCRLSKNLRVVDASAAGRANRRPEDGSGP